LDSYRAELQAVRLALSGSRKWSTRIWITLDNSAVVGDINKCIQSKGKMYEQDNKDIWDAINPMVEKRANSNTLQVTWTKGHATEEDMEKGRTNPEEKARNIEADKLATDGIAMNEADAVMIKATRQRKTITALQQKNS
jgi:ribonuclease HI